MFTSDFYVTKKSFQPKPFVSIPAWFRYTGNLSSYIWVMFIRAVSESLHLSPIPSSEKTTTSCITFTRSQDESNYPQAIQFLIERSNLPPARSHR